MRVKYIPVRANIEVKIPESLIRKLPERVALFTTAQLLHLYEDMSRQLEAKGKKVIRIKTPHTREAGQILGCNLQKFSDYTNEEFDCTLYIGDGLFHPKALLWKNNKPSYMYNPYTKQEYKAEEEEVKKIIKKYNAALSAFKIARVVGVLIPLKPGGQLYLKWALELKKIYPEKEFINLVDYNIDFQGLENYNFCEVFVNSACPRIAFDDAEKIRKPVVNLEDVNKNFYEKQLRSVEIKRKIKKK